MTDNADNNTYWLFWISLRDDEDICDVALKATTVIRNVFREFLSDPATFAEKREKAAASLMRKSRRQREQQGPILPFTREAYDHFVTTQPQEVRQFMALAIQKGWVILNQDFGQHVLQFVGSDGHSSNVDFAVMMHTFYRNNLQSSAIPWTQIQQIFIDRYGTRFENIKGQISQAQNDTLTYWKEALASLYV